MEAGVGSAVGIDQGCREEAGLAGEQEDSRPFEKSLRLMGLFSFSCTFLFLTLADLWENETSLTYPTAH